MALEEAGCLASVTKFRREFMPSHDESADVRERRHSERSHQSMLVNRTDLRRPGAKRPYIPFASEF